MKTGVGESLPWVRIPPLPPSPADLPLWSDIAADYRTCRVGQQIADLTLQPCKSWVQRRGFHPNSVGTHSEKRPIACLWRLSPRLRGNRLNGTRGVMRIGAISAVAEKPWHGDTCSLRSWGYPRGCGGTDDTAWLGNSGWGLSPRLRGNLRQVTPGPGRSGAIPAVAGEPGNIRLPQCLLRGYPRGCGGTWDANPWVAAYTGLSPRLRGNRQPARLADALDGAIPAIAGEPARRPSAICWQRGYPRDCGGTPGFTSAGEADLGLSPRLRGNP